MPLTRFEECWALPKESLSELPYNLNIVTLIVTLWPINSGILTSLRLPQLSSSLTDSLPSLNILCHSKTDARFMQDAPKAVWSLPYVSVSFLPSVTWWLTETRRWEWYSPPVELKLSSSQKVTVRNECGSHRCSHLSDLGSPDIGRGRRKWSQMIGGGTPNGSGVPFPSTEVNTKKDSFWTSLVADGR